MDMGPGHGGGPACKISMLWNWTTIDACFLTSSWHVTSRAGFAASCIGVVIMVITLEFLRRLGKEYDALILRRFQADVAASRAAALKSASSSTTITPAGQQTAYGGDGVGGEERADGRVEGCAPPLLLQTVVFRATPLQQLVRAGIHALTFGLAYVVMLLAMYFNGYIIISIVLGAFVGKFFCDWLVVRVALGAEDAGGKAVAIDEPTVCCG